MKKDNIALGLCFEAAHCAENETLKYVGFTLGFASLAASLTPLPFQLRTQERRNPIGGPF